MSRVGIAGLGRMGTAIAERLLDTGVEIAVWNRTPSRAAALEQRGAEVAASPVALVARCDVVLTCLADDAAAFEVHLGPSGLFEQDGRDVLIVETSTLIPETIRALGEMARARSVAFVECPVLGTVGPARAGQLVAITGGYEREVERAKPVLDRIARRRIHAGDLGSAARLKLTINDLLISYLGILAEAMAFGVAGGLDPDLVLETIAESPAGVPLLQVKKEILRGTSPPPEKVSASLATILKDMRLIAEVARTEGMRLPIADHLRASIESACAAGWQDRDMAETVLFMRSAALGVEAGDGG